MNIWVMQGIHEGEMFATTHMTEKGAALAAIGEVLSFLGVEDEETALSVMDARHAYTETDGEQTEPFEWDQIKLRDMKRADLWKILETGQNSLGTTIMVIKSRLTRPRLQHEHLGCERNIYV